MAAIGGVVIILVTLAVLPRTAAKPLSQAQLNASASTCAAQPTFTCYKKVLTDITKSQSPEQASALVKSDYEKVPYVKTECHQLMHVIGRVAIDKYGDVARTYAHGDQFCWSGYYHGALEEFAKVKGYSYIEKNANDICKPIAAKGLHSFYHYNCVHGIGHGFMFIKGGDLFASLKACDALTDSWERTSCYGGVFMQNIMNEQTPDADADKGSKFLKSSEPMYPCTAVEEKYKGQCYLMQTSYALQVEGYDFAKVFSLCSGVDELYRDTCYTSLGRDASGNSISDVTQTRTRCLLGPTEEAQRSCIRGAAMDFVSYFHSDTQAKELCNSLPAGLTAECLDTVKSYYSTF